MIQRRCLVLLVMLVLVPTILADPSTKSNRSASTTPTTTMGDTVSFADIGYKGWGARVGFAEGVDQVVGGAHFNLGELVDNLRFQPDVQIGTGDDVMTLYATAPLYYRFSDTSRVTPYAGGGLTVGYVDVDAPVASNADDSDVEFGAKATGGVEWSQGGKKSFFVELSLGFGDVHDTTLMAAWSF